ncbi:MAG: LytTR family transcriptional regulator [Bacteroidales bacterium]|nr:LytTR family transcriptional regulator [Clostridium sp.]MCM1202666.1 LytTR family transcriptional regulator [Bacteroidales bacterium]
MIINITRIKKDEKERLEIYCHKVNNEITEIVRFVKSIQGQLTGIIEGAQYEIPVSDVFYIEGIDNKVFIYCEKQVYETRQRLYELEEALKEKHFLRVSKSVLLNLMKIESIKASLNGRLTAALQNGEQIIVSRKYVPELKKALKGGSL